MSEGNANSSSDSSDTTITRDAFLHVPSHQRSDRPRPGFSNSEASTSVSLSHLSFHPALDICPSRILTKPFKTRRKMVQVVPRTQPLSEVEPDRNDLLISIEKKPRLEVGVEHFEEQPVASTSTVAAEQKSVSGGSHRRKKHRRERNRSISFLNRTRMRI